MNKIKEPKKKISKKNPKFSRLKIIKKKYFSFHKIFFLQILGGKRAFSLVVTQNETFPVLGFNGFLQRTSFHIIIRNSSGD